MKQYIIKANALIANRSSETGLIEMIFVFKTSVKTKMQIKKLKPHIDKGLPKAKWNFDLEDIDKNFAY